MHIVRNLPCENGKPVTTGRLCEVWETIKRDADSSRALAHLDKAGFRISHLTPMDATFKHPGWADYVSAIPFLPDKQSTRRIHRKNTFRKYLPLVQELREIADQIPFAECAIYENQDHPPPTPDELLETASVLNRLFHADISVHCLNPRNAVLAELRWTIRYRTGKPHDRQLQTLINAAYRAAGRKDDCYIDSTALDRIEKRQKECR